MEKIKEDNENFDRIKVFFSDDEKLKSLGELLSNKSSRDIIKLLIDKEMYINEIAKKLELKVSLVIHHLQKMESINLLEITNKKIARNGEMHRFFKIRSGILIFPNESEGIKKNGFLKKVFKEGIKFAAVGFVGISSWLISANNKIEENIADREWSQNSGSNEYLFLIPISIIGCSLFLIWFSKKYK